MLVSQRGGRGLPRWSAGGSGLISASLLQGRQAVWVAASSAEMGCSGGVLLIHTCRGGKAVASMHVSSGIK
jgi:hypothetical protein